MCTISVFSRATAAFQHQRQDQGARHPPAQDQWPVSTNFSSSASSSPTSISLPLIPRCSLFSPSSLLSVSSRLPLLHFVSLAAFLSSRSPLILHLSLCTFPTDHYFLFVTLYDELVQVRCSRREAFTGSPFFPLLLLSHPGSPAFPTSLPLSLALHGCSLFLPISALFPILPALKAQHFLAGMFFEPVSKGKCKGKMTAETGNTGRGRREGKTSLFVIDYSLYVSFNHYRIHLFSRTRAN